MRKHPRALYALFGTEIWERFGYYALFSFFGLFLINKGLNKFQKSELVFNFMALVYLTPLLGGTLADKKLGHRKSVIIGAILMSIGYFMFAGLGHFGEVYGPKQKAGYLFSTLFHIRFPSFLIANKYTFGGWEIKPFLIYIPVIIVALGNGFFKPNIGTLVGNLYPQGDKRREDAFNIFYMGVNIGALFGPFAAVFFLRISPYLAFAVCGAGLILATIIFGFASAFSAHLKAADRSSSVGAVLQVALPSSYDNPTLSKKAERERFLVLLILCFVVMFFWLAFHQNVGSLTDFAATNIDLRFWGIVKEGYFKSINSGDSLDYGAAIFQSFNPLFIIFLSPLVIMINNYFLKKQKNLDATSRVIFGMAISALSFLLLVICCKYFGGDKASLKVDPAWLIGYYFIASVGELYISPLGLSLVSRLAPPRKIAMYMGIWYLAISIGNKASGVFNDIYSDPKVSHSSFFLLIGVLCAAAGVILWIASPFVRRVLNEKKPEQAQ